MVCEGGSAAAAFVRAAVDRLIFRLRGPRGDGAAGQVKVYRGSRQRQVAEACEGVSLG